ncbi:hypothetical protein EDD16DRAFT_1681786 [Pisolithus croceorrhizus]|nr:hypothetical protein EDD16DRAFT_1681786 [Pisolithus croceorrhizus]
MITNVSTLTSPRIGRGQYRSRFGHRYLLGRSGGGGVGAGVEGSAGNAGGAGNTIAGGPAIEHERVCVLSRGGGKRDVSRKGGSGSNCEIGQTTSLLQHRPTTTNHRCVCRKSTRRNHLRRQRGDRWRLGSRDRRVVRLAVFLVEVAILVALGSTRISGWASDLRLAAVAQASNLNGIQQIVVGPRRQSVPDRC